MGVSKREVERIAQLARLRPDPEDIERLTDELNGILEHMRTLEGLDPPAPEGDPSLAAEAPEMGVRDPGLEADGLRNDGPAANAPDWRDGFFVVPRLPALESEGPDDEGEATP